jgi:hypothetical protein
MDLQGSVAMTASACDPAVTGDGTATKGTGTLELTVGGSAVHVDEVSILYFKCAKPAAKWELSGKIPSMTLPGDVSFTDVEVSLQRNGGGEWSGMFEGKSAFAGGVDVDAAAEFSSVDGMKSLGLSGAIN